MPAGSQMVWQGMVLHSEVVVVGDEVFRAPGWSAGFLHLHFSVARGLRKVARAEEVLFIMLKNGKQRPRFEGRSVNRVSSAAWPLNVRRVVATGKAAQRRRDWIMQGRWWVVLADVLPMRVLLVFSTLLVVISSLFVAVLGLHFWYLLLLPLLLFTLLLLLPLFVARRMPLEAIPPSLSTFTQEFRSSTGLLSLYAQELKSNPGFLQELRSNPGYLQELKSNPGFLQDLKSYPGALSPQSPATPMPTDPPLVRVLETYDLREARARRLLGEVSGSDTGSHRALVPSEGASWSPSSAIEQITTARLENGDLGATSVPTSGLAPGDSDSAGVPASRLPGEEISDAEPDVQQEA